MAPLALTVDWAVAAAPMRGELVSGDLHAVKSFSNGMMLAAIDGLGHGAQAAEAARRAVVWLEAYAHDPVIQLVQRCHEGIRRTRGAVLTVASFNFTLKTLTCVGVGNVDGILFRADPSVTPVVEDIPSRGGVVGFQLPPLRALTTPLMKGDTLILATDGIHGRFRDKVKIALPPQAIADDILARHHVANDDALVLVARYLGP